MTNTDFSTTPRTALQPTAFVVFDPTATAQRAGDTAYALVQAAGLSPEECADAYHVAFVTTASEMGQPVPCACDLCATLNAH